MDRDPLAALRGVFLARSRQLAMRLGVGGVLLVGFGDSVGWSLAWSWLGFYAALQLVEVMMTSRIGSLQRSWPWLALLVVNSVVFGAFAIALCWSSPPWGFIGASLLLAGAVLNTVVVNVRCKPAFAASLTPYAVYCAATPGLAWHAGASLPVVSNIAVGVALIVTTGVLVWRQGFAMSNSEALARQELETRRCEAEAAVEAKGAFVAMVSHELRTPLTAIAAAAARASAADAPPAVREAAASVDEAAKMMKRLLDDLLDLAKLDAERLRVEEIAFEPAALLEDVAEFWRAPATQKGLALNLLGSHELPPWAVGDPLRIRQVLNNLLSNAIKFTAAGQVTLRVRAGATAGGHRLTVTVSDTGPGLDAAGLGGLFEPYAQGSASIAREFGGTGLGLAISRRLARLMGGDLVASTSPAGATFTFLFEVASAPDEVEATDEGAGFQPLDVLVVDDHASNRHALALLLKPAGARVDTAEDGEAALVQLAARRFDLVLMDVTMAKLDGLETMRRLRRLAGPNQQVPVIGVTGHDGAEMLAACRAAGMAAVVVKPVEPRLLFAAMNNALNAASPETGPDQDLAAA